MRKFISVILFVLGANAYAISEGNYAQEYQEKIIPVINNYASGSFIGMNSVAIHYATYSSNPTSTRCLVILPGRTESIEKYAEVIHSLDTGKLAGEFTYFLMDHRGQGSSGRMIDNKKDMRSLEIGHVDQFDNYSLDLKIFMDTIVSGKKCSEKILLAHSLGGGIGVDFMQKYPEYFSRAALSSPMLKILTKPFSYGVAQGIVKIGMGIGNEKKLAIKQELYDSSRNFSTNTFTSSPVRYEMAKNLFDNFPQTRLGGVTYGWLNEIMKGTKKMRDHYGAIKIPLHIFYVGIESYVNRAEIIRLCITSMDCHRSFFQTSKHEVLMDRDINRDRAIGELEDFFR